MKWSDLFGSHIREVIQDFKDTYMGESRDENGHLVSWYGSLKFDKSCVICLNSEISQIPPQPHRSHET